jgi:hypothetical protein
VKTEQEPEARPRAAARAARRRTQALTALGVIALLLIGLGARFLGDYLWDRVVEYDSPYRFDLPHAPQTPRLADRVLLVVVDGLREDVAAELPTFQRLGEEGSYLVARSVQPSLSYPGWTALVTGAPPEISGVTTNWYEGRVEVDDVFASADRAGLVVAMAGDEGWRQLFPDVEHRALVPDVPDASDPRVARRSLRLLEEVDPDLFLVHLSDVDKRGHAEGVEEGYLEASERADGIIERLVEAAGPGTAVILTSDHGHVDVGGHGGPEPETVRTPLVLAGAGLVPGARGEVAQEDVAPLISALLGIGRPVHAVGELREELLDAPDDIREEVAGTHEETASALFARATEVIGGSGDTAAAFEGARDERLQRDILARLPIGLAVIAVVAILLALASHRLDGWGVMLGVLVILGVMAALYFGRGLTFSFSHFNTEDQVEPFLLMRVADALLAGVAGGVVAGLVAARRRRAGPFRTGVGAAAWAMFLLGVGVTTFLVLFGWGFAWRLPNLPAGFGALIALLGIFALGVAAWLVGLVAAGVGWVARPRRM